VKLDQYNDFCGALPHVFHVVQWGGAHVWKVGGPKGKVFAICWPEADDQLHVTFKCSQMSFDLLKDQPGVRPAPYLASRGMLWLQRTSGETIDDEGLEAYLRASHRLAALNLPRALQRALKLGDQAEAGGRSGDRR
jgi:predicted DNA-binding protein (MmcQ/YjbR family)